MFRFTIRDLLWLTVTVALVLGLWLNSRAKQRLEMELRRQKEVLQAHIAASHAVEKEADRRLELLAEERARAARLLRDQLSDQRFAEINEKLQALGWSYNPRTRQYEDKGDSGRQIVWKDVISEIPRLTFDELIAFEVRKQIQYSGDKIGKSEVPPASSASQTPITAPGQPPR